MLSVLVSSSTPLAISSIISNASTLSSKSAVSGSTSVRTRHIITHSMFISAAGPLLWHFENTEGSSSIELTLEDIKLAAKQIGFTITEEREIQASYTSNPLSMLRSQYDACFWVCTKV